MPAFILSTAPRIMPTLFSGRPSTPAVAVSPDGRYLAYADNNRSATVIYDTGSRSEIKVLDFAVGPLDFSDNGQWLTYSGASGIAVLNLASGATTYASTSASGASGNGASVAPAISADGRYVAFTSYASNLVVKNDTNGVPDVFVKDMLTGAVIHASTDGQGGFAPTGGTHADISGDGKVVLYRQSDWGIVGYPASYLASNLASGQVTTLGGAEMFSQGTLSPAAVHGRLSGDGRYGLFETIGNLVPGDTNGSFDVYRMELATGVIERVSVGASGSQGLGNSIDASISADGRFVAFTSFGEGLTLGAAAGKSEIYLKDMLTGTVSQVSYGIGAGMGSQGATISADGTQIAFSTIADASHWDIVTARVVPTAALAIEGGAHGEVFAPAPGDQLLAGGGGIDTAAFHGKHADYTVAHTGASFKVSDSVALRDGADTLSGIERLQFSDEAVALDVGVGENGGNVYRLFQAAFNRTPDAAGLGFWIKAIDGGLSLTAVAQYFVKSDEFIALYGNTPSNAELVDKFYLNVLHRTGDAAGIAFWNQVLDNHQATVAEVLSSFSTSAENVAALVGVLDNGFAYITYA